MPGVTRVIAGIGGSPGSLTAIRFAEALARAYQAVLVPVLAWIPPGGERAGLTQPSGYLRQEWRELAHERMRAGLLAVWGEIPADPLVQPQVEEGLAGLVLVSVASQPGDILVIGAGRRGPLHRLAGRPVSRYCAAHARCPVILVPPPELATRAGLRMIAWELSHRTLTPEQFLKDKGA
jgi:nucleotide-binding universal stress UspA family protein